MAKPADVKKEEKLESSESGNNPSSSECDSNDGVQNKGTLASCRNKALERRVSEHEIKEELGDNDSYYEGESDLMDTEFMEEDVAINTNDLNKTPEFAIANVSCQYDGSPGTVATYPHWGLWDEIVDFVRRVCDESAHQTVRRGAAEGGRVHNARANLPDGQRPVQHTHIDNPFLHGEERDTAET
jgi:hypothetical protein